MLKVLILSFSLVFLTGCNDNSNEENRVSAAQKELKKQKELFQDNNLSVYTFRSYYSGFTPYIPVIIDVVDDLVTYVYEEETFEAIDDIQSYATILQRFDIIEKELDKNETSVSVVYDEEKHYPKSIAVSLNDESIQDGGYTLHTELFSGISCTAEYVSGIHISIFDMDTNVSIGCNSVIDINSTKDAYSEQLSKTYVSPCTEPEGFSGLGEKAGLFDIFINTPEYKTKLIEDVRVNKNICHVIPVELEVYLEKKD